MCDVWKGASHGIRHQLGLLAVGHGETNCILLPAVMKYNKRVNATWQENIKRVLWGKPVVVDLLGAAGQSEDMNDVGDALDVVFRRLGMPGTLKQVGIRDDKLKLLAKNSLGDGFLKTNPIPLTELGQVREGLEMVAG